MWQAKRAVHVGGIGACAAGALLADGEPLVAARPAMFERVPEPRPKRQPEPVADEVEPVADDDDETTEAH